jgi:N-acetylmuramoyl-L-alanine amidase
VIARFRVVALSLAAFALLSAAPRSQRAASAYTVVMPDGKRMTLPFRTAGNADLVSLDQLAAAFGLTLAEDAAVGGLTVRGRGQTILLIPGQSMASVGPGRIVSLPAAVQQSGNTWFVPVDFMRLALGPALGLKTEIRRQTHLVVVGDVRLPEVTPRFERVGGNGRLTLEMRPAAATRVTREGNRLVVRVEAAGIDLAPATGLIPELVSAVRAEGTSLAIDLGSAVSGYRVDTPEAGRLVIDVLAAGAPPPPPPTPAATDPPVLELPPASGSGVRTIVIDPGHGGPDGGVTGPGGTREKDYVLNLARRLKTAVENRLGLRVLLTRDGDELVPVDRRTSLANNNKADLFISLHANASRHSDTRGAQVLALNAALYQGRLEAARTPELPVPVVTGGSRAIDIMPWDLAQMPYADASARVADVLVRRLTERKVPLFTVPTTRLPLRPLVGANMPAVLVEVGFLSSARDESALKSTEISAAIVEAIVDTISEVRRDGSSALPVATTGAP